MARSHDRCLPALTRVDLLASMLLGVDADAPPLPEPRRIGVRAALEAVLLPVLQRTPCAVSFSGGRDSSLVLAVATDVARRHGLADPVPITKRYASVSTTDETSWQELVLDHLGIREHVVLDLADELDALGAAGTSALRRVGLRWPANAYMHVPVFEAARGGHVLTGIGGDELFQTRGGRLVLVRHGRSRPRPSDGLRVAFALAPRRVRAVVRARWRTEPRLWLTQAAAAMVGRAVAEDAVDWPERWDRALHHWSRSRSFSGAVTVLPALAEPFDVTVSNPLMEPTVLAELAGAGGPTGFASRAAAMAELAGDLLPAAVLERATKATFGGAVWGPATRDWAARWTGAGLDLADVDAERLRKEWLAEQPHFATMLLLQQAWLAERQASASSS